MTISGRPRLAYGVEANPNAARAAPPLPDTTGVGQCYEQPLSAFKGLGREADPPCF